MNTHARAGKETPILITGIGTVGLAVVERFSISGFHVIAYDMDVSSERINQIISRHTGKITTFQGDVRDLSRLIDLIRTYRIEAIVHTAAVTYRSFGRTGPAHLFSVNTIGTLTILEAARLCDVAKVIFTSSGSVLSQVPKKRRKPLTELESTVSTSTKKLDPYAVSKYSGELLLNAYHDSYGIDTITCRLQWVYGIGEKNPRDIGRYLRAVLAGATINEVADGNAIRADYSYNRDVAEGIFLLYKKSRMLTSPLIYNISGGKIWKLKDVIEIINKVGPGRVNLVRGVEGPLDYLKELVRSAPFDISRAKALGYNPRSLPDAVTDYASWLASHPANA